MLWVPRGTLGTLGTLGALAHYQVRIVEQATGRKKKPQIT